MSAEFNQAVSEEMVAAAREVLFGQKHSTITGDDLIRAMLEAAVAIGGEQDTVPEES